MDRVDRVEEVDCMDLMDEADWVDTERLRFWLLDFGRGSVREGGTASWP